MSRVPPAPLCLSALLVMALAAPARAGDLTPPPGPVGPTMKPLDEVEPRITLSADNTPGDADSLYRIVAPGSYRLVADTLVPAGLAGIEIAADDVTIDLGGFTLRGGPGSLGGILATGGARNRITIRDGNVTGIASDGINLVASGAGKGARLVRVTVSGSAALGARVGEAASVSECLFEGNGSIGLYTGVRSVVQATVARGNGGDGMLLETGGTLASCVAADNAGAGLVITAGSCVSACSASFNGTDGIRAGLGNTIRDNTCFGNGNGGDGAGIRVTAWDNRIEGNLCTSADSGIRVESTGNLLLGNACSGNQLNWDVVAGNVCFVIQAATSGAISGNSGGTAPGSLDPSVNVSF